MYTDGEEVSDLDEDFRSALALLHSSEENSTEKLRRLLDAAIEKNQASNIALSNRESKKHSRMTKNPEKPIGIESQGKRSSAELAPQMGIESGKLLWLECQPLLGTNAAENDTKVVKLADTEYDDCSGKVDIPRISIPDEGSADEQLLCKICNGARLGPLILLECQDCQDGYHPLCHQPPVVDIDVYDPRIVWRCSKCIESSPFASSTHASAKKKYPNKFQYSDNVCMSNERTVCANKTEEDHLQDTRIEITTRNSWTDLMQSSGSSLDIIFLKDTPDVVKETTNMSTHAVKKRIGSKFLVVRPLAKR